MAIRDFGSGRHAGVLIPLFSIPSSRSWGIGEITDLVPFADWLSRSGFDFVQLLPVNEMAPGQHSPYSALSALAIDPIYLGVHALEDVMALAGEATLEAQDRQVLDAVRGSSHVEYEQIRALKVGVLRAAFTRFLDAEWSLGSARAARFRAFRDSARAWLDDYALFRALHARDDGQSWRAWPPGLRDRHADALAEAHRALEHEVLFHQYVQWLAHTQWQDVRRGLPTVGLFGDFPFMVAGDSVDVWVRPDEFRLDASVGTPPDDFSETGQEWGLPPYRWDEVAAGDFAWLRQRVHRSAELYDGYRIDHLVGFYRTYVRLPDGSASFEPADEERQTRLGERLIDVFRAAGSVVIAEDLGTVPDFVRASLARLDIPGYKVLRWEREWKERDQPFRDPTGYPAHSVATTGTHDMEPMAVWWQHAEMRERAAVCQISALREDTETLVASPYSPAVRDACLRALFTAGSNMLILPVQDIFGWEDVINVPATVADTNWTYRLPWLVDRWADEAEAVERTVFLHGLSERSGRGKG